MEKISSKKIKEIEIGILDWIDKTCEENKIQYFLAAGTLLGAVRHKGFIPWDDDVDIFMKRVEYEKFIRITSQTRNQRYNVMSLKSQDNYYYPYIKVVDIQTSVVETKMKPLSNMGVWVDIFPLDNYVQGKTSYKKLARIRYKLIITSNKKYYPSTAGGKLKSFVKYIYYWIYGKNNPRKYALELNALAKKYNAYKSNYYYIGLSPVQGKDKFNQEWFSDTVQLEFEGKKYPAPIGYDAILKHRYGNYMKLPPEDQRVSLHDFVATYKE